MTSKPCLSEPASSPAVDWGEPLPVLVVEQDEGDRVIAALLHQASGIYDITSVQHVDDALALLRYGDYPICLLDADLGDRPVDMLLGRARRSGYRGAWIVLCDHADLATDLAAMQAGAHAYLIKAELKPHQLERCVRYALCLQRRLVALQELARRDPLTSLLNLRSFEEHLETAVARARRQPGDLALLYIDLDGFKQINDSHGHDVGNELLVEIAARLTQRLRRGDVLARVGGDEFAVILESLSDGIRTAGGVAEALIETVREPLVRGKRLLRVAASVGIALCPADAETPTKLMQCADSAMYSAKGAGGGAWSRYEPFTDGITGRWPRVQLEMESEDPGSDDG